MQQITSIQDISQLGTILGVWAHPDDEAFTCGGLLAAAVQNGQRVACITATKGEAGEYDKTRWPNTDLGSIREQELAAAYKALGLSEHYWLGYMDGQVNTIDSEQALKAILAIVQDVQPDTIITFAPDGLTGHPDHIAVSAWAGEVARKLGKPVRVLHAVNTQELYDNHFRDAHEQFNIYFNIDKPNLVPAANCSVCIKLPDDLVLKKVQALQAMPSQYEKFLAAFSSEWAADAFGTETLVDA